MKKQIDLHQVDAFTSELFGGNPAGVVTNADGLSVSQMCNIAREMNLSETAFVLTPTKPDADLKLRYFTPGAAEIDFCGHATVGALYELARLNQYGLGGEGIRKVRIETNTGVLDMAVETILGKQPRVMFDAPAVAIEPYHLQGAAFAKAFGVPARLLKSDGTILVDRTLNYVYVPAASLQQLGEQQFDFARVHENFGAEHIVVFCFYTNETIKTTSDLHARGLAPLVGINEDPFTGSMQSGLLHAAKHNHMLPQAQENVITEQGDFIGRSGSASLHHNTTSDSVTVTAGAVQVFSTTLELA